MRGYTNKMGYHNTNSGVLLLNKINCDEPEISGNYILIIQNSNLKVKFNFTDAVQ